MKFIAIPLLLAMPLLTYAAENPDAPFFKKAAEGGIAEVDLGKLAQKKSQNPSVQQFGAMMVKDHSAANEKLNSLAASKGISLPTSAGIGGMEARGKLELLTGDTFDKSYIKGMVKDHEEDIAEFKKEAASGRDADAKAYAAATLPTLEAHLSRIKAIAATSGVAAK